MKTIKKIGKFVPKEKLSKKARRKMDAERRNTWAFSPVTKKIESKKAYNRKKLNKELPNPGSGEGSFLLRIAK